MSYGMEFKDATGKIIMTTEDFGLQIVDNFAVASGASGSRAYPELAYHNKIFATTMSDITGTVNFTTVAGHSFMDLTIVVDGSNIPTVSWATSNAEGARTTDGTFLRSPGPTERDKPDTRIIILAG